MQDEDWVERLSNAGVLVGQIVPEEQKAKKLLILDSGGGALLHLNAPRM